jgi:hypothetical protein
LHNCNQSNSHRFRITTFFYQNSSQVEPELSIKDNPPTYDALNIPKEFSDNMKNNIYKSPNTDIERIQSPPPDYSTFIRRAW